MALYDSGTIIRVLREQKKLTQKELASGVCSNDEISRIERGKRRPDRYTFFKLIEKLGEQPEKFYTDIVSADDKWFQDIKDELVLLLNSNKFDELNERISQLEKDPRFGSVFKRQFLLKMQAAAVGRHKKEYGKSHSLAIEAIRLTKPTFNEDTWNGDILTYDEITIINTLSICQFKVGNIEKAAALLRMLKHSLDLNYVNVNEKMKTYIPLLYNLSNYEGHLGNDENTRELCKTGLMLSEEHRELFYYPLFAFNLAYACFKMGRVDDGIPYFKKAIILFEGYGREEEKQQGIDYILQTFQIDYHKL